MRISTLPQIQHWSSSSVCEGCLAQRIAIAGVGNPAVCECPHVECSDGNVKLGKPREISDPWRAAPPQQSSGQPQQDVVSMLAANQIPLKQMLTKQSAGSGSSVKYHMKTNKF